MKTLLQPPIAMYDRPDLEVTYMIKARARAKEETKLRLYLMDRFTFGFL